MIVYISSLEVYSQCGESYTSVLGLGEVFRYTSKNKKDCNLTN